MSRRERNKVTLEQIPNVVGADIINEYGKDNYKAKIAEQLMPLGLEHIKIAESVYADKKSMRKRKREEKKKCYDYIMKNHTVTPQSVGCGPVAAFFFWIAVKSVCGWLVSKMFEAFFMDPDLGD